MSARVWVHRAPFGWFVYADPEAARRGEDTARDLRRLPFTLLDVELVVDEALRQANPRSTHAWAVGTLGPAQEHACGEALRYQPLAGRFFVGDVQVQHIDRLLFTTVGPISLCCICHPLATPAPNADQETIAP